MQPQQRIGIDDEARLRNVGDHVVLVVAHDDIVDEDDKPEHGIGVDHRPLDGDRIAGAEAGAQRRGDLVADEAEIGPADERQHDSADHHDDEKNNQDHHSANGEPKPRGRRIALPQRPRGCGRGEYLQAHCSERRSLPTRHERRPVIPESLRPFVPRSSTMATLPRPAVACRRRTGGNKLASGGATGLPAPWCVLEASQVRRKEGEWRI